MSPLPEADITDMEYFIIQAKIVLSALGVNIFRSAATADDGTAGATSSLARILTSFRPATEEGRDLRPGQGDRR